MIEKEMICISCPVGCLMKVKQEGDNIDITGNACPRGIVYGKQEMIDPRRILTTTMRVENGFLNVVPVKTDNTIPKGKLFEIMEIINCTLLEAPIKVGDILIENILGTGTNIVAARDMLTQQEEVNLHSNPSMAS